MPVYDQPTITPPETAIFWDTDPHSLPTGIDIHTIDVFVEKYSSEPLRHLTHIFYELSRLENPNYLSEREMPLNHQLEQIITWYAKEDIFSNSTIQSHDSETKQQRLSQLISESTRLLWNKLDNPQSLPIDDLRKERIEQLFQYEQQSNSLQTRLFTMLESIDNYDPTHPPSPLSYPFLPTEIDNQIDDAANQPFLESSNYIRRLEWSVRALYNQVNLSPRTSQEMSAQMLKFYQDITPQLQEQGETKDIWTDSDEMRRILMQTIEQMWQEGIIPRNGKFLVVGVGNGNIDLQALLKLGIDPKNITAIDILDKSQTGDHSRTGITYADNTNLIEWANEHGDKYDAVICTSTGTVNEENFLFHFLHFQAVKKMLKKDGVYIYEARNLEVDPDNNEARDRAIIHSRENPNDPSNTTYINPKYAQPGEEKKFGASIEPVSLLQNILELVGLDPLNYIFRLPTLLRKNLRTYPLSIIDENNIFVSPNRTAKFEPGNNRTTYAIRNSGTEKPILNTIIQSVNHALSLPRPSPVTSP